jgi:hypothetical protein
MRILFICKKNANYGFVSYTKKSSGLFNSTRFIVESLNAREADVEAKIVEVNDNNDIDREVHQFKPGIVVIEAFWVVPEKFDVLKRLHPSVRWFCHLHSNVPFLSNEGNAMAWTFGYVERGVNFIVNSPELYAAMRMIIPHENLIELPNVYLGQMRVPRFIEFQDEVDDKSAIDVGCFGAIRPFKNHLNQAIAAIHFGVMMKKRLKFHVNASRVEGGTPQLKNLRALFAQHPRAELIEVPWLEPDDFLNYIYGRINLSMQVSFTETFNVVTADSITAGVPIVVSPAIPWVSNKCKADPNDVKSITETMTKVWRNHRIILKNQQLLKAYSKEAQRLWFDFARFF